MTLGSIKHKNMTVGILRMQIVVTGSVRTKKRDASVGKYMVTGSVTTQKYGNRQY
jgi:hypothetical protein